MPDISYDLHIHSTLSPCGDDDMLPSNIVGMAAVKNLDVIAVTDHNSCRNCKAAIELGQNYGVLVIPGMEICTSEEVHVVCLFRNLDSAMGFNSYVFSKLPKIKNDTDIFGKQLVYNSDDEIIGLEDYILINATDISFDSLYDIVAQHNGIIIPAHIDKSTNSLLSNLGFIPSDSKFKCAEIKHIGYKEDLLQKHEYLKKCNIITNSDAHYLEHINEPLNFISVREKTISGVIDSLYDTIADF